MADENPYAAAQPADQDNALVYWRYAVIKTIALAIVGFLIPTAMLVSVEYTASEFGPPTNFGIILTRYLPPSLGCSLLFTASAIASSVPNSRLTFVQALFILGTTFIVSVMAFTPIQHYKSDDPPTGPWGIVPAAAVSGMFLLLMVFGRKAKTRWYHVRR